MASPRRRAALAAALLLVPLLFVLPSAASDTPDVWISELAPVPTEGREFIELAASAPLDLSGWSLTDAAGTRYYFPNGTNMSGHLVVWTGGDASQGGLVWSRTAVWNNDGDTANLHRPDDTVAATVAYGSGGEPVPDGNQSLQWTGTQWVHADPTPGAAYGAATGEVTFMMPDLPPTASFGSTSSWTAPEQTLHIVPEVEDPNGVQDIGSWTLYADDAPVAHGESAPTIIAYEPTATGTVLLRLEVQDDASNATATHTLHVRPSPVALESPANGTALEVRDDVIETSQPFVLRNDDNTTHVPLLDVSPLRGIVEADVRGLLSIGWETTEGITWHPYEHALQVLPAIPPGGEAGLRFRLDALPPDLPAGPYGLSFAVVA